MVLQQEVRRDIYIHTGIKHLDNDFHFVPERVRKGDLQVEYISICAYMGLRGPPFLQHCSNLGYLVINIPSYYIKPYGNSHCK